MYIGMLGVLLTKLFDPLSASLAKGAKGDRQGVKSEDQRLPPLSSLPFASGTTVGLASANHDSCWGWLICQ